MSNKIKFEHIKKLWYLKDGVIYTRYGNKPVSFSGKAGDGRRFQWLVKNHEQLQPANSIFHVATQFYRN